MSETDPLLQCMACGEQFLDSEVEEGSELSAGNMDYFDICPHCGDRDFEIVETEAEGA